MLSLSRKKIKSALRQTSFRSAAVFGIAGIIVLVVAWAATGPSFTQMMVGSKSIRLEIADTEGAREKGLGGRSHMSNNDGMLFVFDRPAKTCFWMKGMRFPLDIIWLDSDQRVVTMYQDLSQASYPKSYCPNAAAKYVVELNAGQAAALDINGSIKLHINSL